MREYIELGSSPCDEECAQVGQADYETAARIRECLRFIDAIRAKLGPEPPGARLVVKGFSHDYGTYYEVVCWYDPKIDESVEYAFRCESESPKTWEG